MRKQAVSMAAAVALCAAGAQAGVFWQLITFGEHPIGTSLDGMSVGVAQFEFVSASEPAVTPVIADVPINGGTFGATDNILARGVPDGVSMLRLSLDEGLVIDELSFGITTLPFSPAPFTASIGLVNASGNVFETRDYATNILVNLANGLPLLRYGQHAVDLSLAAEPVYALEFVFTGNANQWMMDNIGLAGHVVPAPGVASLALLGLAASARRRRLDL